VRIFPWLFILTTFFIASGSAYGQKALSAASSDPAITNKGRLDWVTDSTIGPASLIGGTFSSAFSTAFNNPTEYGPTWAGFGKRYGMRLTGVATSNVMEASLGTLWGEDPRYFRADSGSPFKKRVWNIFKMTFVARNSLGEDVPAFARYMSVFGSNYLSNTWRPDSDASSSDAAARVGFGFMGRMAGNAFQEFWPDVKRKVLRR